MKTAFAWAAIGVVAFGMAPTTVAQPSHATHALGRVTFPVSCSPAAQASFLHAVALLHHMTYPQARRAFEALAAREPDCAMAHWGVAMTLFQPLWPTRPTAEDMARGRRAVEAARAAPRSSARERLFIDTAAAFFADDAALTYWDRIRRWEQASRALHIAFPQDPEATAFYALSHLATMPPDHTARTHADRAAELLLTVYQANPEHPGAMHYLVHANDVPGRERELMDVVRKYETIAPHNPHALHMPTHIYTRIGDWPAVIRGNGKAAAAALAHPAGADGQYVWDEFPHAVEYLVYAHLQRGDDAAARTEMQRLHATPRLEPSFKTAFHLSSTAARHALERRDWPAAAALPPRSPSNLDWDRFPWPEAVTHFARALGSVHGGRLEDAEASIARLAALEATASAAGEGLFARSIRVLRLGASAWLMHANGDRQGAVARMREAADLEARTPKHAVTPAPTLPAHELLGDLYLAQDAPREALRAFEKALSLYPNRFNALQGAARAAAGAGDNASAARYRARLETLAVNGAPRLDGIAR